MFIGCFYARNVCMGKLCVLGTVLYIYRGSQWFDILVYLQGRLKPGRMLLVDTKKKVFLKDEDIKSNLANLRPVASWLQEVIPSFTHYPMQPNKPNTLCEASIV